MILVGVLGIEVVRRHADEVGRRLADRLGGAAVGAHDAVLAVLVPDHRGHGVEDDLLLLALPMQCRFDPEMLGEVGRAAHDRDGRTALIALYRQPQLGDDLAAVLASAAQPNGAAGFAMVVREPFLQQRGEIVGEVQGFDALADGLGSCVAEDGLGGGAPRPHHAAPVGRCHGVVIALEPLFVFEHAGLLQYSTLVAPLISIAQRLSPNPFCNLAPRRQRISSPPMISGECTEMSCNRATGRGYQISWPFVLS